jgi:hypothetical protein
MAQANPKVTSKTRSKIQPIVDDGGKQLFPYAINGLRY